MVARYGSALERLRALASIGIDEYTRRGLSFAEALTFVRMTNQAWPCVIEPDKATPEQIAAAVRLRPR